LPFSKFNVAVFLFCCSKETMEQDDVQDRSIPEGLILERAVEDLVFTARGIAEVTRDLFEEINSDVATHVAARPPLNLADLQAPQLQDAQVPQVCRVAVPSEGKKKRKKAP
jgi:hypothetical protein